MEVTVQKIPGSQVVLEFSLEEPEVEQAIEKTYRRLVRQLRIPGFRPGKAPRFIVERYLGAAELRSRAIEDLAPELVSKAVEEHQLRTVGRASVEILQQKPARLKATVPVYPEVTLADYRGITLEPPAIEADGPEVEAELLRLRENKAQWIDLKENRPASSGDLVILEIVPHAEGAEPNEVQGVLGKDQLVDELEAAVIGHSVGDTVTFQLKPEKEGEEAALYRAAIKAIKVQELPPLDDELAKSEGHESVQQLREAIRSRLQKEADERFARELLDAVVEASQVELPQVLIDQEALTRLASVEAELRRQGLSAEWLAAQSGTDLRGYLERLKPSAERDLKRYMVAEAIAQKEGLEVPQGEALAAFVARWLAEQQRKTTAEGSTDESVEAAASTPETG